MDSESDYLYAATLCRRVCALYGVDGESAQIAVEMALRSPVSATDCYQEILNSLEPR